MASGVQRCLGADLPGVGGVVAVDLPNHGGSGAYKELTTVSQQAGFLPKILDHFDLANPHYVGPDIGTPIAVRFMADNPRSLRSAVIGDAGAVGDIEGELFFRLFVKSRLVRHRQGSTSFAKLRGQVGFLGSYPDETPALEQVAPTIETPVLVLHGEQATFVGIGNSRRLADALPNSELHLIADAGHYSWEDNPEPYLAHVLDWIERAEAADQGLTSDCLNPQIPTTRRRRRTRAAYRPKCSARYSRPRDSLAKPQVDYGHR